MKFASVDKDGNGKLDEGEFYQVYSDMSKEFEKLESEGKLSG